MAQAVLDYLKSCARQFAPSSGVYRWGISGDVPERLLVRPADPWPGNAEYGRMICDGQMPGTYSADDIQSFIWLRDLRSFSHGAAQSSLLVRAQARLMIHSWIQSPENQNPRNWRADIAGERIAMWVSAYEFFTENHVRIDGIVDDFEDDFYESLAQQACHLALQFRGGGLNGLMPVRVFQACKGLLYAGLALEGREDWVLLALSRVEGEIDRQILTDGMHRSRSPAQLLAALQALLDIRMALSAGGHVLPESIQHAIDKMGPALRFFKYNDKGLGCFHGTQECAGDYLDMILTQAGVRGKVLQSLPVSGFERVTQGRTSLMFDCGAQEMRAFDVCTHAAPLAFEMSYGRERVFVNCGSHPAHAGWQDALRATAAHNTLTLNDRNAYEICESKGHFVRRTKDVQSRKEHSKDASFLQARHDGYVRLNGAEHQRRLYLCEKGHDLRGEDEISSSIQPSKAFEICIRFHLHPRVMVSLIRDGQEALLRLPGGTGWRFSFSAGLLSLEDSLYLGQGCEPRKTKQLAIYGQSIEKKSKIQWAFRKEG